MATKTKVAKKVSKAQEPKKVQEAFKDVEKTEGGNLHKLWCQFPVSDEDQGTIDRRIKELGIGTYGAYARLLMSKDAKFKL